MIKRFIAAFAVVILSAVQFTALFALFALFAHADVVMDNDFFMKNREKTIQVTNDEWGGRWGGVMFIVESPNGYVAPKMKPGSREGMPSFVEMRGGEPFFEELTFENGSIIAISHAYRHRGEYWGVMTYSHTYSPPGWVRMDELLLVYTSGDFGSENFERFYRYTGDFDAVLSADRIVVWQWPGSDREKMVFERADLEEGIGEAGWDFTPLNFDSFLNFRHTYKDKDGREWGNVFSNVTGSGWFCLSDPENNSDIPAFHPAPESRPWVSGADYENESQASTVATIIAAVMLITVAAILIKHRVKNR
jgi:hypothetical protein